MSFDANDRDSVREAFGLCGCADDSVAVLASVLVASHQRRLQQDFRGANEALAGLLETALFWLEARGLVEHGGNIRGAWPTPQGAEMAAALHEVLEAEQARGEQST